MKCLKCGWKRQPVSIGVELRKGLGNVPMCGFCANEARLEKRKEQQK